ncbi:MAG: hypothetical protein RLZZ273_1919 [Bacteroidota bacterium]|jgi:putative transposase
MRKSHFSDEQIVKIVRESHAEGVPETAKKYKVSKNSIYIWRKKFDTMEPNQVSELKRIMQENARLKKLVAEREHCLRTSIACLIVTNRCFKQSPM